MVINKEQVWGCLDSSYVSRPVFSFEVIPINAKVFSYIECHFQMFSSLSDDTVLLVTPVNANGHHVQALHLCHQHCLCSAGKVELGLKRVFCCFVFCSGQFQYLDTSENHHRSTAWYFPSSS